LVLLVPAFALLGLFTGSFLNVCIDRLPAGQSLIRPPSHCPTCQQKLGIFDLVPLFSYLWLRGRCRYCQAPIPVRLPIIEGASGLIFAGLYCKFGLGLELAIALVYACLLTIIFVIDLERQLVLDIVVYPGMVVALAFSFFWPGVGGTGAIEAGGLRISRLLSALAGGGFGLALMALPYLIYRRGMGLGDVKLGALIGLMTGYPLAIMAWLLSVIAGGLAGVLLLGFRVKGRRDPIPFAPFLATSAMITLLWGQVIYRWYFP